jgi:HK97 gp10 family phage protein
MAVEVVLQVQGVEQFQAALSKLGISLQDYVRAKLSEWAELVKAEARAKVPVRTGYLQSTIYSQVKDWVVRIGAEATYALFVEFGTRYMRAQPYIFPAVQKYLDQLEKMISEGIEAAKLGAGLQ